MDYLIHVEGAALPWRVVRFGKIVAYCKYRTMAAGYQR